MNELPPNYHYRIPRDPENLREPDEAKRHEARQIAQLTDILWSFFYGRAKGEEVDMMDADAGLDVITDLVISLSQRDPEMGRILIEELESGPGPHAEVEQAITDRLRAMQGLPPWQPTPSHEASLPPAERDE